MRRTLWVMLRKMIGTAWAKAGRSPGTGQLCKLCRNRKCHKRARSPCPQDQRTQERPTYASGASSLRTTPGAVLRLRDLDLKLSEGSAVMSLPIPIPGDPAGLQEAAGLWGSAHSHLLGADSCPLHGGLQEAHRQARCGLEPCRRGPPEASGRGGTREVHQVWGPYPWGFLSKRLLELHRRCFGGRDLFASTLPLPWWDFSHSDTWYFAGRGFSGTLFNSEPRCLYIHVCK